MLSLVILHNLFMDFMKGNNEGMIRQKYTSKSENWSFCCHYSKLCSVTDSKFKFNQKKFSLEATSLWEEDTKITWSIINASKSAIKD